MKTNQSLTRVLVIVAGSYMAASSASSEEIALGNPEAPVTLIEYGSLTCGGCIKFHKHVLPRIKKNYIDPGKVRFIFRHFPTSEVASEGAIAAQCSADKYYEMLDKLYFSVASWANSEDKKSKFTQYAVSLGLNSDQFKSCLVDGNQFEYVSNQKRDANRDHGVVGTPTFIVNGEIVRGIRSFVEMKALINKALGEDRNE